MHILRVNASVVKLLQFTDLHLGEDDNLDMQTISHMRSVLQEERPDFAVYSGDLLSGYAFWGEHRRQLLWKRALSVCQEFHVPFATLFGNHDDQPYHTDPKIFNNVFFCMLVLLLVLNVLAYRLKFRLGWHILAVFILATFGYANTLESRSNRLSLQECERFAFPSLSYTQSGPDDVRGTSNYKLVMYTPLGPVALYFIDSGGGWIPEDIHETQANWLRSVHIDDMPSIAFVHIPPFPHDLFNAGCAGPKPLEASSYLSGGTRILDTLNDMNTSAVFVGHDHGNEWCCPYKAVLACYGKHSGYGGYSIGVACPGVRVIELHWNGTVHTRVRQEKPCITSHTAISSGGVF